LPTLKRNKHQIQGYLPVVKLMTTKRQSNYWTTKQSSNWF